MKTYKGFASLILVGGIALLLIALLALTVYSRAWRSYTYNKYRLGYTIKYPISWVTKEIDKVTIFSNRNNTITISITPEINTNYKTLDTKVIEYGNKYDMKLHGNQTVVDDKAGFEFEFNDRPRWDIVFAGDDTKVPASIFTVSLTYQNNNKEEALSMLKKVLATMHITEGAITELTNTMEWIYGDLNYAYRHAIKYPATLNDVDYLQRDHKLSDGTYLSVKAYKLNKYSKNIISEADQTRDLDKEVQIFNKLNDGQNVTTTYGDSFQTYTLGSKERIGAHKYLIYDAYNKTIKIWSKNYVTYDAFNNQLIKVSISFEIDDPTIMHASYEKTKGYYYDFEYPEVFNEYIKALNSTLSTL